MTKAQGSPAVSRQFASTARLFSADQFARLRVAHVGVVGLGGVGSWAAESLARSGVGALTLVDMDHVAESNLNRQVQALHSTLGAAKGETLKSRILDIAPDCVVNVVDEFLTAENASEIMINLGLPRAPTPATGGLGVTGPRSDDSHVIARSSATKQSTAGKGLAGSDIVWIDATDDLAAKRAMILTMQSRRRLKDLIVSGGAGGKTDPTRIEAADLSETTQDPLLSALRYDLRKHHGFARSGKMKIQAVVCRQPMIKSDDCDPSAKLACAGYGSLVTVTATMGMVAATLAILRILSASGSVKKHVLLQDLTKQSKANRLGGKRDWSRDELYEPDSPNKTK